jgi:hypothetical protein
MTRRTLASPALAEQTTRILVSNPATRSTADLKFLAIFKLRHCRHLPKMSEETEAPVASSEPQARHIVYCGGAKPFWSWNTFSVE